MHFHGGEKKRIHFSLLTINRGKIFFQLLLTVTNGITTLAPNSNASCICGDKILHLQSCKLTSFYLQYLAPSLRRALFHPSRDVTVLFGTMYWQLIYGPRDPSAGCTQPPRTEDTQPWLRFPFTEEQHSGQKSIRHTTCFKENRTGALSSSFLNVVLLARLNSDRVSS